MFVTRNVRMKYFAPAGEGGSDAGGTGTGEGAGEGEGTGEGGEGEKLAPKKGTSDEEARLLKENMKKKEDLRKAGEQLTALQAQLKAFEGIDPEAVRKMLADQKAAEDQKLEAKGDFDRLKLRMAEEHSASVNVLKDQIAALQAQVGGANKTINELSIGSKFGQSVFISEEMLMPPSKARAVYASHFDLEDGKVVGYDKPRGEAGRTALVDQFGIAVGFDDALRKIVDADPEKDYLLRSKVKAGAGSDSKKGVVTIKPADMSGTDKIAAGLKGLKAAL